MPIDPYDVQTNSWGGLTNKFYVPKLVNGEDQTLASYAFGKSVPLAYGTTDRIMPHTVIKHTVYVHCGVLTSIAPYPPILYSFSWIYDNTRGRMRYYPFCPCNSCPSTCTEQYYDIAFTPEILYRKNSPGHYYSESDNTIILPDGTLDYYPYDDLPSIAPCNMSQTFIPANGSLYAVNANISAHPYFPPYSLISAPAMQWRADHLAGYDNSQPNVLVKLSGIEHTYFIDKNIDLNLINSTEKNIYNPSEVNIAANNLVFPAGYTFKTILGRIPSWHEVNYANAVDNGGPYSDPRDVPVPVNVTVGEPSP